MKGELRMNKSIAKWYEQYSSEVTGLSDKIFANCEIGLDTYEAAKNTAEFMKKHGFDVEEICVGGVSRPNGVIARYGSGKPVYGILGELDGLPGLANEVVPKCAPIPADNPGPGHGCGHHLMGAGCAAAAVALKAAMEEDQLQGTVIYYGCPAEETLDGKVYMARDGLFDELDLCWAWHPMGAAPMPMEDSMQANISIFFNFYGKTAHAAANPDAGRSALDAAEIMNVGVNYLREHVTDDVRMHYCYTNAGEKPNIIANFARLHYYIRAKSLEMAYEVLERVKSCAEGAAIMTGTTTKNELFAACYETCINHTLNKFTYDSMKKVPALRYDEADYAFAAEIYQEATGKEPAGEVLEVEVPALTGITSYTSASTDVGDVSHLVPTTQIFGGAAVKGLPFHHWTTTATTGSTIGHKAELYAGKCLAQSVYDAFNDTSIIEKSWTDFKETRKQMKPYKAGLPE